MTKKLHSRELFTPMFLPVVKNQQQSLTERMDKTFLTLDYEAIIKLEEEFYEFRYNFLRSSGLLHSPIPVWENDCKRLAERKKELGRHKNPDIDKYYRHTLLISAKETSNGYQLYEVDKDIFDYENFIDLSNVWDLDKQITDSEFLEWLKENTCSDWAKQDRHGNYYGNFWKYPEGSFEKENAYHLSWEDNLQGLLELPFPREVIKRTVILGCNNRMESVRYSNFICTWLKRKRKYMSD